MKLVQFHGTMLFLLLNIVLISGFGLLLKHARNRGHRLNPIGFINYLTAFLISVWSATRVGHFEFTKLTLAFGLTNGVTYATGFELVTLGIRLSGVVVTIAVVRLSLIVPIIFSIIFWDEIPNLWQAIGIILACCALPLLGTKPKPSPTETPIDTEAKQQKVNSSETPLVVVGAAGLSILVVALLLINSGISRLAMKAFNEMCPLDQKPMYLLFLFSTTTLAYAGVCIYQKTVPTLWEGFYGILIGICNIGGSWAFLTALDHVDALIAFPVSGSGGVMFTTLVGVFLLKEQLSRKSLIGIIATVMALIFVNIKEY